MHSFAGDQHLGIPLDPRRRTSRHQLTHPPPSDIGQASNLTGRPVHLEEAIVLRYFLVATADLDDAEANSNGVIQLPLSGIKRYLVRA